MFVLECISCTQFEQCGRQCKICSISFHTVLTVIWNVVVYFFTHSISQAIFLSDH